MGKARQDRVSGTTLCFGPLFSRTVGYCQRFLSKGLTWSDLFFEIFKFELIVRGSEWVKGQAF